MHSLSSVADRHVCIGFTNENVTDVPRSSQSYCINCDFKENTNFVDSATLAKIKQNNSSTNYQNIAADLITYDLTIDPDNLVCFYGRHSFLSNFYNAPMKIDDCTYPTVEHYYAACKLFAFGGPMYGSQLCQLKRIYDPGAIKTTVKRLMSSIDTRIVDKWKITHGIAVLEKALVHKFNQHKELSENLLSTGDALLVHGNPFETLWASSINAEKVDQWAVANKGRIVKIPREIRGDTISALPIIGTKGQNVLGYLLMQIRHTLREKKKTEHICKQMAKITVHQGQYLMPVETKSFRW